MPSSAVPPDALAWPTLTRGKLIRRYKRFLVDAELETGQTITAHCPNSGSMKGLIEEGTPVFLSRSDKTGRKTAYTLEMIQLPATLVGVNTQRPNPLVARAIRFGRIPELAGYETLETEKRYGRNSRIDILLTSGDSPPCFIEVKNCTLVEEGIARFPDAVTSRGLKHLVELQSEIQKGHRAVMFYLVNRMDARGFSPADEIDPAYGKELRKAVKMGVEVMAWDVSIDPEKVSLRHPLPCLL